MLTGKSALITGGSAGIGKAIAKCFVQNGAKVTIFGTNQEKGGKTANELGVTFMQVDVSSYAEVELAISKIEKVDILVNNAGITRDNLMLKLSEEDWDQVMSVNVKSCYNTCHALMRSMLKQRSGKIINMSSVIAMMGNEGQVNYGASKAAIIGFTRSLAKEVAKRGINVNCIAPGFIKTAMTESMTESARGSVLSDIPMGRIGQPEDVAHAALFLASDLSDYITGQVLTVDGGLF